MSCHLGPIKELAHVSVDRFGSLNYDSTVFFISHAHEDHLVGLQSSGFIDYLAENREKVTIYCSEVTKSLLLALVEFKFLAPFLRALPFAEELLTIPAKSGKEDYQLSVTLIPANHCPGSAMFLFQRLRYEENLTILYTGDFRLGIEQIPQMKYAKSMFFSKFSHIKLPLYYTGNWWQQMARRDLSLMWYTSIQLSAWIPLGNCQVGQIASAKFSPERLPG